MPACHPVNDIAGYPKLFIYEANKDIDKIKKEDDKKRKQEDDKKVKKKGR